VCDGGCITEFIDVVFCQGKLYYTCSVACRECTTDLFAFEISEDNNGLMVSRVDGSVVELPVVRDNYDNAWSIVEWRGKLQLVATYYGDAEFRHIIVEVRLFEADLSTNPVRVTEIENLDGDCIFISPCSSKSFRHVIIMELEKILSISLMVTSALKICVQHERWYDGTTLAADGSEGKFCAPDDRPTNAAWLFPPE
jgi:hypothetical protein